MSRFSYKPAPLAGRQRFELTARELICRDDDGADLWRLELGTVESAAFVEHKARATRMRRLDLRSGGRRRSLGYNGPAGDPAADPEGAAHLELCAAVLDRVAGQDGGMAVRVGEYGRARIAIFAIGLVSASGAVALFAAALASGLSGDRIGAAAVPLGLMLIFGVALILGNAPWKAVPKVPARPFAEALRAMARPDAERS